MVGAYNVEAARCQSLLLAAAKCVRKGGHLSNRALLLIVLRVTYKSP